MRASLNERPAALTVGWGCDDTESGSQLGSSTIRADENLRNTQPIKLQLIESSPVCDISCIINNCLEHFLHN